MKTIEELIEEAYEALDAAEAAEAADEEELDPHEPVQYQYLQHQPAGDDEDIPF